MKVLVTGGSGFLGKAIVRLLLKRGDVVRSFGRRHNQYLADLGVEVFCGDLSDYNAVHNALDGVDAVIHTAAEAGVWGSWESYYEPNVVGTKNVVNDCRKHGIKRLVYTSTPSVVFNGEHFSGDNESLPYGRDWLCHYAHTKAIAEQFVLEANSDELKTVALRPHLIWGVGDPHIVPKIIERASSGELRVVGNADNLVDITHVDNAAEAHLQALDALEFDSCAGKAYFLSQGEPVNLWDWANEIIEGFGLPKVKKKISLRRAYLAGAILEFVFKLFRIKEDPPLTRFVAVQLAKNHYFDISNAKKDFRYSPKVTTEEGLKKVIDWLKSH